MLILYSHLLINLAITAGFLYVSRLNYPGATALLKLHELEAQNQSKHILIFSVKYRMKGGNKKY